MQPTKARVAFGVSACFTRLIEPGRRELKDLDLARCEFRIGDIIADVAMVHPEGHVPVSGGAAETDCVSRVMPLREGI